MAEGNNSSSTETRGIKKKGGPARAKNREEQERTKSMFEDNPIEIREEGKEDGGGSGKNNEDSDVGIWTTEA